MNRTLLAAWPSDGGKKSAADVRSPAFMRVIRKISVCVHVRIAHASLLSSF